MNKSRTVDTSRSERASKIVAMVDLINEMRNAISEKSQWTTVNFSDLLKKYEKLATPSSNNKVDTLFIEQFNNQFTKLCNLAPENVRVLAKAHKAAIDRDKDLNKVDVAENVANQIEKDVKQVLYLA